MRLNGLSDEELMAMYQSGAEDAFQILYQRHSAKVYGFLRGRILRDERAAELFQEAFMKIHRSKHLYNKSLAALPWIFSITRSVLIDGLRVDSRAKRDANFAPEEIESAPAEPHETAHLIGRLPSVQRKAIELRYVDERTFEEVAVTLETSPQNARKIISRAIAKLREFTAKEGESREHK